MEEIPQVSIEVLEHSYRSIGLFGWPADKRDAFGLVRLIVAYEVVSVEK